MLVGGWTTRRIDRENQSEQVVQGVGNPAVGQLVPSAATFGYRNNKPASPQASKMVRQDLA
ncbi:hypothetical protein A5788_03885 [Gordonia sp. 852002-50816_SCH5313054-c]|uniref:Uncharacterized protein n=1 Tax=Gordonia jacobaea TaxID=122202 RepID=A0ABR5IBS6_9ACTN|nr:hypothetical protein ABW18_12135 [Gordonia jacobaea]OBC06899.1 hypothetical protein A5785_09095 [Gordonia sp. 852002-50395_SCH5434458]OBC06947.1 hypothetical protein A5786_01595 [Gordonia sp. 852002-50816_SCH5313054-a]OBC22089.1 hypothetical protein A5788_03885 [Gordonia sp. 852002-50816_SCH5313054-c]